eukprot:CAMPEP_0174834688 /NCGR_PEP_ID=MMETSP1114-20130205/4978_1 /TAXON_ID=312471 /ORGANISM="Neobodo designis, Strain CCAP 1951/1" /LENGTH=68 /DNA_ID=CAMNT_0016068611 /DNA_START=68 /DNA_END=271 /DNA_ORIENTATION=-
MTPFRGSLVPQLALLKKSPDTLPSFTAQNKKNAPDGFRAIGRYAFVSTLPRRPLNGHHNGFQVSGETG